MIPYLQQMTAQQTTQQPTCRREVTVVYSKAIFFRNAFVYSLYGFQIELVEQKQAVTSIS